MRLNGWDRGVSGIEWGGQASALGLRRPPSPGRAVRAQHSAFDPDGAHRRPESQTVRARLHVLLTATLTLPRSTLYDYKAAACFGAKGPIPCACSTPFTGSTQLALCSEKISTPGLRAVLCRV
jgi:hypothetical protein